MRCGDDGYPSLYVEQLWKFLSRLAISFIRGVREMNEYSQGKTNRDSRIRWSSDIGVR